MARIVLMKDTEPLVLSKETMDDDEVWVCRCGLSAKWPLCDSSHALARRETDGKTYRYHRARPGGRLESATTDEDAHDADPRPAPTTGGRA